MFTTPVLTPRIDERIPLLEFTAEEWNEGHPVTYNGSYANDILRPRLMSDRISEYILCSIRPTRLVSTLASCQNSPMRMRRISYDLLH